jgi:hypothetical protein
MPLAKIKIDASAGKILTEEGVLEDDSKYYYLSALAIDKEGDTIIGICD